VKALNSLQSNRACIQERMNEDRTSHSSEIKKLEETVTYLTRYVIFRVVLKNYCRLSVAVLCF
jgi:hypothetical protein